MIFRKAKLADLSAIVRLLADDVLGKERENPLSETCYENAFMRICADPNQFLMVVEDQDAVIGTCHLTLMPSLTFQGSLRMHIEAVRIASAYRGRGIGEWMFKEILAMAHHAGCKILQLMTNEKREEAKRFYEKVGFKATHDGMKLYL